MESTHDSALGLALRVCSSVLADQHGLIRWPHILTSRTPVPSQYDARGKEYKKIKMHTGGLRNLYSCITRYTDEPFGHRDNSTAQHSTVKHLRCNWFVNAATSGAPSFSSFYRSRHVLKTLHVQQKTCAVPAHARTHRHTHTTVCAYALQSGNSGDTFSQNVGKCCLGRHIVTGQSSA